MQSKIVSRIAVKHCLTSRDQTALNAPHSYVSKSKYNQNCLTFFDFSGWFLFVCLQLLFVVFFSFLAAHWLTISINLFMAQFNLIAYRSIFSELFAEKKSVSLNELKSVFFGPFYLFLFFFRIKFENQGFYCLFPVRQCSNCLQHFTSTASNGNWPFDRYARRNRFIQRNRACTIGRVIDVRVCEPVLMS